MQLLSFVVGIKIGKLLIGFLFLLVVLIDLFGVVYQSKVFVID